MEAILIQFDSLCSRCHNEIPRGTVGIFIEGEGVLHPECKTDEEEELHIADILSSIEHTGG